MGHSPSNKPGQPPSRTARSHSPQRNPYLLLKDLPPLASLPQHSPQDLALHYASCPDFSYSSTHPVSSYYPQFQPSIPSSFGDNPPSPKTPPINSRVLPLAAASMSLAHSPSLLRSSRVIRIWPSPATAPFLTLLNFPHKLSQRSGSSPLPPFVWPVPAAASALIKSLGLPPCIFFFFFLVRAHSLSLEDTISALLSHLRIIYTFSFSAFYRTKGSFRRQKGESNRQELKADIGKKL